MAESKQIDYEKFRGLENELCPDCQRMIEDNLTPIYNMMNSRSAYLKAKARVKLIKLQTNLWKKYCPTCLGKIKKRMAE